MQPDRLYRCSDTIKLETLAVFAACALSRVVTVESWSQMTGPNEATDPCLTEVFEVFDGVCSSWRISFLTLLGSTWKDNQMSIGT